MFKSLRERLAGWKEKAEAEVTPEAIGDSGRKIKEDKLEEILYDLEIALLESDVAFPVEKEIVDRLAEDLRGKRISREVSLEQGVEAALRDAITKALSVPPLDFFGLIEKSPRPFVVMFVGVNGTGKTTTIAKLAYHIMKKGYTCVVAAADTFRAGAIEQLEKHAEAVGFKLIKHNAGADPAAVAFDAVEHARARGRDVVLIDTAGRMQTNQNLMDQMKKIKRVAKPNLVLYIGDALAGNDAIEQAKQFHEAVGLDGIVLTKIDADAKGGAALSMAKTIGKPVVFVNLGQTYKDIRRFDAKWMVDRLLAEYEDIILGVDTNILYASILGEHLLDEFHRIHMRPYKESVNWILLVIPGVVMKELENAANMKKGNRLSHAGRRGYRALQEITTLKGTEGYQGLSVLVVGPTNPEQLHLSPDGLTIVNADSMIRDQFKAFLRGIDFRKGVFFLTMDKTNASLAAAEGLTALRIQYPRRLRKGDELAMPKEESVLLARLVYELAIEFGTVRVTWDDHGPHHLDLEGAWTWKSMEHWEAWQLMVSDLDPGIHKALNRYVDGSFDPRRFVKEWQKLAEILAE